MQHESYFNIQNEPAVILETIQCYLYVISHEMSERYIT